MMHTTIGLDIGKRAIRCAVCNIDGQKSEILQCIQEPITDDGLEKALQNLSAKIAALKIQADAIGATLDSTLMLSAHRSLPFNDPKAVEQILPQSLGDVWVIDGSTQIAFEIGSFVEQKSADDSENKSDGDGPVGGYDVYAIHYPRAPIERLIDAYKAARLEPHVMLPACEAFSYGLGLILESVNECWCLVDIGEEVSTLYVIAGNKVVFTRSFKLGSINIDEVLAETYGIGMDEARNMKERTGFVAVPGREVALWQHLVQTHQIEQWDVDPVAMSQNCLRGLNMLFSSLRQTLINYLTKSQNEPTMMVLTGNGAQLAGLTDYMTQFAGVPCTLELPMSPKIRQSLGDAAFKQKLLGVDNTVVEHSSSAFSLDAVCIANAAALNIDGKCPLNLRRGALAHKGSLAFIQDNKWILAALFVGIIAGLIFMTVTKANMVRAEHDRLKAALEQASEEVFGKKLLSYSQIESEINQSKGYDFIPEKTAFTHLMWISNQVSYNLSDVEMDFSSLEIDNLRKIVSITGDVSGDDGLPKFMQLMEQYECFPDEIQEPKTSKKNDRTHFTLRIESNHCTGNGGDNE